MNTADATYLKSAIQQMKAKCYQFLHGLTDKEVVAAETRWGFKFPPDLRAFLQIAMPANKHNNQFPNWRSTDKADIDYILNRKMKVYAPLEQWVYSAIIFLPVFF